MVRLPKDRRTFFFLLVWLLAASLVFFITYFNYSQAFEFGISFDDLANLAGLAFVEDKTSALKFIFDGQAGPFGRPLALASFLINVGSWPDTPQDFLYTNSLVHLLNGLLITLLSLRLVPYIPWIKHGEEWFALAVGCLWISSPLLMSTSLMIVQRMTSLSATFALATFLAYVIAWSNRPRFPRLATLLMAASVAIGTALSALTKETGALVPLYVWVLHVFLLESKDLNCKRIGRDSECVPREISCSEPLNVKVAHPQRLPLRVPIGQQRDGLFSAFKLVFFFLPAILLAGYAIDFCINSATQFSGRNFGLMDRVLTELRILFEYLRLIILPDRPSLGPFHDDYEISRSLIDPATTLAAAIGWIAVIYLSLKSRRTKWRIVGFGFAWFLTGHLLESSIFPLELYFEHRNYLPAFGIYLSFVAALWCPNVRNVVRIGILSLLCGYYLIISRENGLVWSNPLVAGVLWYQAHPDSERAISNYSRVVAESGDLDAAMAIFESGSAELQEAPSFAVAKLLLYCGMKSPEDVGIAAKHAAATISRKNVDFDVPLTLERILALVRGDRCRGVAEADIVQMLSTVASSSKDLVRDRAFRAAHVVLSKYWLEQRNLNATMYHLEKSYEYRRSIVTAEQMVEVLLSAGLIDEAEDKLIEIAKYPPTRPFVRDAWYRRLGILREKVELCRRTECAN